MQGLDVLLAVEHRALQTSDFLLVDMTAFGYTGLRQRFLRFAQRFTLVAQLCFQNRTAASAAGGFGRRRCCDFRSRTDGRRCRIRLSGTYVFAIGLGLAICTIGTLVLLGIWCPRLGMLGGLLTFGMSIVTLSFLITTPECWVPNLADGATYPHEGLPYFTGAHGFPLLSAAGRLVIKDVIMSAGGLLVAAEAARRFMAQRAA